MRKLSRTCKNCGSKFTDSVVIDGIRRKFNKHRYCLTCSPWQGPGNIKRQLFKYKTIDGVEHRRCSGCKQFKAMTNDFYMFRKDGKIRNMCKVCEATRARTACRNHKLRAIEYKGGKCQDCRGIFLPGVYDFHHLDPSQKDFTVSQKFRKSWDLVQAELDKCVLLCANCHRTRHALEENIGADREI